MVYTKARCRVCGNIHEYVHQHERADSVRFAEIKLFYFARLVDEYHCEDCDESTLHDLCGVFQNRD
jgi:hypothetical protein